MAGIEKVQEVVGKDRRSERIDEAADFLKKLDVQTAKGILLKIRSDDWAACNGHQKFRVLANLGHVAEREGDAESAARLFLEAKDHDPECEKARQLEAIANGMLGKLQTAVSIAEALVSDYPNSPECWSLRIQLNSRT